MLLNVYNLIITKERLYVYYVAYILTFIIFTSMKSASYLSFGFSGWSQGLHTIGALLITFLVLFSGRFLKLYKYMPQTDTIFKFSSVLFFILSMLIAIDLPYSSLVFNVTSAIFLAILFITAMKVWSQGFIDAKYYLIALMIYSTAMGMMVMTFNAFIDNTDISRYSFFAYFFYRSYFV